MWTVAVLLMLAVGVLSEKCCSRVQDKCYRNGVVLENNYDFDMTLEGCNYTTNTKFAFPKTVAAGSSVVVAPQGCHPVGWCALRVPKTEYFESFSLTVHFKTMRDPWGNSLTSFATSEVPTNFFVETSCSMNNTYPGSPHFKIAMGVVGVGDVIALTTVNLYPHPLTLVEKTVQVGVPFGVAQLPAVIYGADKGSPEVTVAVGNHAQGQATYQYPDDGTGKAFNITLDFSYLKHTVGKGLGRDYPLVSQCRLGEQLNVDVGNAPHWWTGGRNSSSLWFGEKGPHRYNPSHDLVIRNGGEEDLTLLGCSESGQGKWAFAAPDVVPAHGEATLNSSEGVSGQCEYQTQWRGGMQKVTVQFHSRPRFTHYSLVADESIPADFFVAMYCNPSLLQVGRDRTDTKTVQLLNKNRGAMRLLGSPNITRRPSDGVLEVPWTVPSARIPNTAQKVTVSVGNGVEGTATYTTDEGELTLHFGRGKSRMHCYETASITMKADEGVFVQTQGGTVQVGGDDYPYVVEFVNTEWCRSGQEYGCWSSTHGELNVTAGDVTFPADIFANGNVSAWIIPGQDGRASGSTMVHYSLNAYSYYYEWKSLVAWSVDRGELSVVRGDCVKAGPFHGNCPTFTAEQLSPAHVRVHLK